MPSRKADFNTRGVFIIMRLPIIIVLIWNLIVIIFELFIGKLVFYIIITPKYITTIVWNLVLSICPPWRHPIVRRPSAERDESHMKIKTSHNEFIV